MPDEPPAKVTPPDEKDAAQAGAETGAPTSNEKLTPEEQMARFEDALKEEDWGHQPC